MGRFVVLSLLSLLFLGAWAQEEGGAETTVESPDCARSLEVLEEKIRAVFSEEYDVTFNCLSFDNVGALVLAVASGFNGNSSIRYNIECRRGVLVAEQSIANASNISNIGCVTCMDTATDICSEPCDAQCERCYNNSALCSRCSYCNAEEYEMCEPPAGATQQDLMRLTGYCGTECESEGGTTETDHDLFNFCECTGYRKLTTYPVAGAVPSEEACAQSQCVGEPQALESFDCVSICEDDDYDDFSPEENTRVCFAGGFEFCVELNSVGECTACLAETFLFPGEEGEEPECFACPLRPVAECALEQLEEVEEEEAANRRRSLELAISLPIVCCLVILFFIGMSVLAHLRYPHISLHGHKRHRKPQATLEEDEEEIVESEEGQEPGVSRGRTTRGRTTRGRTTRGRTTRGRTTKGRPEGSSSSPPPEPAGHHIWRARPTVHFR